MSLRKIWSTARKADANTSAGASVLARLRAQSITWIPGLMVLFMLSSGSSATLSDPEVDSFNVRIGTQTFAGLYQFTTNTLLLETAQAIQSLGSDVIKMYLGASFPRQYRVQLPGSITNLLTLARDEPSCRRVLDMPFKHIIAWAYPFANSDASWEDGYSVAEAANDYRELYDLTHYLLTNYDNSAKTFYLGHWEGDGYLMPWTTNAPAVTFQGMIDWLNNRQKAIDDAKADTPHTNVNVFGYAEANRVRDAMLNGPTNNQRAINKVVPYVTNLDYLSYSSYDAMDLAAPDLYATLDYMEAHLPTNKVSSIPGERIWVGEYGWGGYSTDAQEPLSRSYIQRLLNYGRKALPYILFWEIYDNETNRNFCLIDSNNVKVACFDLHQRFINQARLRVAQFKERFLRLPTDSEFVSLASPLLDKPLPAVTSFSVTNLGASVSTSGTSASLSGMVAPGIYGEDCAQVWVFWGRQDGGTSRTAWEESQFLGLNTNFSSTSFSVVLTNLVPQTNYFFHFYATNAAGETWAPASSRFSTSTLIPADYGSRMKISFAGYNRSEVLLNFPALVRLGSNLPGFSYKQFATPTGGDLRFTDSNGATMLPHEIDVWNTNGVSTVWVRVPRLSDTNDFIWAYWGNPLATNPPAWTTNGEVWYPEHLLVWHMRESAFPYADSADQHPATSGLAPVSTPGLIGRADAFDGTSQFLSAGVFDVGHSFTLSSWLKLDPGVTDIQTIWANKPGGWNTAGFALYVNSYQTSDQKLIFESGNGLTGMAASTGTNAVDYGQWHHVAAVIDQLGGSAKLYIDGTDSTQSSAVQPDFPSLAGVNLGRFTDSAFYFKGILDEVRIQASTQSPDWLWASWMAVASNAVWTAYDSVLLASPSLSVTSSAVGLLLTWPASGVGFALYSTTNLATPTFWNIVTNAPKLVNTQWQILLEPDVSKARFFRIQSQ